MTGGKACEAVKCVKMVITAKSRELIRDNVDLYIFGFECVEIIPDGIGFAESATPMTVKEGDCVISAGSGNDTGCDAAREIK